MSFENGRPIELLAREKHIELLREAKNAQLVSLTLSEEPGTPIWTRLLNFIKTLFSHEPITISTRDAKCAAC